LSEFYLYFSLGLQHILDFGGYDHILFVTVLCGIYLLGDWKQVLILVTAFTIGHSITLALSVFDRIKVNSPLIEFLIPLTILLTAFSNIINKDFSSRFRSFSYLMALLFGLIHGMGFSNYLKSLLGSDNSVVKELFAFNAGLECGQILIVMAILGISWIMIQVIKVKRREWNLFLSSAIMGIALVMAMERLSSI